MNKYDLVNNFHLKFRPVKYLFLHCRSYLNVYAGILVIEFLKGEVKLNMMKVHLLAFINVNDKMLLHHELKFCVPPKDIKFEVFTG